MKPHPRIRKTIKWGGAALTVLLVVVWIGSRWWFLRCFGPNSSISIVHFGAITCWVGDPDKAFASFWSWDWGSNQPRSFIWWFHAERHSDLVLFVPLWPAAVLSLLPTALAWNIDARARRRARLNLCPKCTYNRAGLAAEAKCPECGAIPKSA